MRIGFFRHTTLLLPLAAATWLFSYLGAGPSNLRPGILSPEKPAASGQLTTPLPDVIIYPPVSPVAGYPEQQPIDSSVGTSKYERWLRGELGGPKTFHLDAGQRAAQQALAWQLPPQSGISLLSGQGDLIAPTPGITFDSLDVDTCCASGATVPPDPELSAGPNHLIAVVNVAFEIYDKSGQSLIGPTTLSSFFSPLGGSNCTAGGPFDPNTLYDEAVDRFMIAADGRGQAYCVAVSQTNDPTGGWWLYEFPTATEGRFFDYPHAGIGQQAIYMGANLFIGGTFNEGRIWALDKTAMYAGEPASSISRSTGINSTPQPINLHGFNQGTWPQSGPHYILTDGPKFDGAIYTLYTWDDPFGTNSWNLAANLDLPAEHGVTIGFPVNNVQSGGSPAGDIQANDVRVLDFEYRNGSGWTTMSVACNPGGGTVNCLQWAEINLAAAELVQSGVLASNGEFRYFPDIAANHCGDAALGYTKSSPSMFPSVWTTGRQANDPPGVMQVELALKAGEVSYTAFDIDQDPKGLMRWGDYTGMTIDPDGLTFWYLGEYSKDVSNTYARWGTAISSLTYPGCNSEPDFRLAGTPSSQVICLNAGAAYTIDAIPLGPFAQPVTLSMANNIAGYSAGFSGNPVTPPGSSTLTLTHTTGGAAGSYALEVIGVAPSRTHTVTLGLDLQDTVPTAPQPLAPPDGASGTSLNPGFNWSEVAGADGYLLEIAADLQFTTLVYSATVANPPVTPTLELESNHSYYWRVTANNSCGSGTASRPWLFTTAKYICRTPALDIPDNQPAGISDTLTISSTAKVVDLNVYLDVSHGWVGDLAFTMTHGITSVPFIYRPGTGGLGGFFGCNNDDIDALIDDEGTDGSVETTCNEAPALSGSLTPAPGQLSEFDGQAIAGTWTLNVSDHADSDAGRLNQWCLALELETFQLYLPLVVNRVDFPEPAIP